MSYVYNFEATLNEMRNLYERKNTNYGGSIHETFDHYGMVAYLVRMEDKVNRLRSLVGSQDLVGESVRDTLMDLANYAALAVTEIDARRAKNIAALVDDRPVDIKEIPMYSGGVCRGKES